MKASSSQDAAWLSFMTEPARYIDPARFTAFFDGSVSPALSRQLQRNQRLQHRLSSLLHAHYKLDGAIDPQTLGDADKAVALATPDGLATLAVRAGAIYWSAAIASTVLAKAVTALQQQLGEALITYAMDHRDLAAPTRRSLEPLETVGERIQADGWRCLADWCDASPPGIALRVRLKLPPGSLADQPALPLFKDKGAAIIRRAAV